MLTKQLFPLITSKSWLSLLIKDDKLLLINTSYKTEEAFVAAYEKKSIFRTSKEILISDIVRLAHPENAPRGLYISVKAASRKIFLDFAKQSDMEEVVSHLQQQLKFKAETIGISKFRAITPSLIGLGITALFTWITWGFAIEQEAGEEVETYGRYGWFKKLLAWVAEQLGSQNTLIVGGGIALVCLYFMYKALQNPPNEVVYE